VGKNLNYIEESKVENINLIFDLIRNNDEITRVMLADMTNLTRMNITRLVGLLMDRGLVYEDGEINASRGRPAKKLHINPHIAYSISVNIDVGTITVAVVNLKNEIIIIETFDAEEQISMEDYVDKVYEVYKEWKAKYPSVFQKIGCIAFVGPGIINSETGEIVLSAQLGWRKENISNYASKKFGMKVIVDNDVKSALMGELAFTEKRDNPSIAYMAIGYGVGVGLWIDGKILRGANNNAGEIGHISIDYNGEQCNCGRRGCLDTVLSIRSFLKKARSMDKNIKSIKDISERYHKGEDWAIELVDDASRYFSIAINNIVYAYDPDKIIVGGLLFDMFPGILDIMMKSKHFRIYGGYIKNINIIPSLIGNEAYVIGGAIRAQSCMLEKMVI